MLGLSMGYAVYGVIVSIYLYGRKTDFLRAKYAKEDAALEQGVTSSGKTEVDSDSNEDLYDI